jgi:hypothetical protein
MYQSAKRCPLRRPLGAGVGVLVLCALLLTTSTLAGTVQRTVHIETLASTASYMLESTEGQALQKQYESLNGDRPTRTSGPAIFLSGTWLITGRIDSSCQVQLAVNSGSGWQLFAWTSDRRIVNGTINSWGTIIERVPELATYQETITLPPVRSGRFMLIWSTPAYATNAHIVRAHMVYACGGADRHPDITDVRITHGP